MKKSPDERKMNALAKKKEGIALPIADITQNLPPDYSLFLKDLKTRIRNERIKFVLSANSALVMLYWDIGYRILKRQDEEGWGGGSG